jgi:uncharacterized OB-fold protein
MPSAAQNPARLSAPHILEYPYRRSVGPVLGRFFTGLRDGEILAGRSSDGRLLVPPPEYDPATGEPLVEFTRVADVGSVVSWTWITAPKRAHPFQRPFAWALVKLDGADSALVHAIDVESASRLRTGLRVRARWRRERVGDILDIECFEPV